MKSAILSIGTEILFGEIENSNSRFLSDQLNLLGIDVLYHHSVGDNRDRLSHLLKQVFEEVDLVIATGGLGPTQDDLTKETVSSFFNEDLVLHDDSLKSLESNFKRSGSEITENNYKQAYMPKEGTVLTNKHGTAPGFVLSKNGKIIVCMPGPPREMKPMFCDYVVPYLHTFQNNVIYHKMIRTFGLGESHLETMLLPLIDGQKDPTIATYAKEGETSIRVASKRKTLDEAREEVLKVVYKICEALGDHVYSIDDEDLHIVVGNYLMNNNITISSAESCTGGLFAGKITEIPGISKVFDRGLVTYSNRAKIEELGVSEDTLEKYGAVSKETAEEMADGLKRVSGSDLCIAITGIAGPEGGTLEKPVGLSYIAVNYKGSTFVKSFQGRNVSRRYNRRYAVLQMFNYIRQIVK
ncbi:MAG: competence/damage-inducible protein A [Anaerovoracaceae bacterium]|nr:competence/damage-inducible protein A [Clostridiales bacterium]